MSTLGKKIRYLRKKNKLSQEALAEKLGVKRATLANWEVGRARPDYDTLMAIAKFFGVTLEQLISADEKEQTNQYQKGKTDKLYKVVARAEDLPEENIDSIADALDALIKAYKQKDNKSKEG